MAVLLASCGGGGAVRPSVSPPTGAAIIPGQIAATRLTAVAWQQVPGWQDDSLIGATAALRQNCLRLARQPNWARACAAASQIDDLDVTSARAFFEAYFTPFQLANNDGTLDGLVTGYYEPLLRGSRYAARRVSDGVVSLAVRVSRGCAAAGACATRARGRAQRQ